MEYKQFQNIKLSRLGMGNMRLPAVNPADPKSPIDYVKAHEIIDYAYNHGVNYFDTAYVYNNGESEKCLGECMKKYPRESFYIATKFHILSNPDYKEVFRIQLERLQTDYIDFYLIHCLTDDTVDKYIESGAIEFFLEMKKQGKIKYLGFSSHAGLKALEKFANHHQWDFAQLQLNYYDWEFSTTKEEYKILKDRNIPIMVMEPVRGGKLANLTPELNAELKARHEDYSVASYALRFVKSLSQVQVILSGMSTMDQVIDNVKTFSDNSFLNEEDCNFMLETARKYKKQLCVPCTACRYCIDTCPSSINIPEILSVYNTYKCDGPWSLAELKNVKSEGMPSDCIGCGQCTGHCPQNIDTPSIMAELTELTKKYSR